MKKDSDKIIEHIKRLKNQPWITDSRKWWLSFLFHCTDIKNACSILKTRKLLSRQRLLKEKNIDFRDIASESVINKTHNDWKKFVRLYFRPKAPTQYRNEGIIPKNELLNANIKAHCPVPIYFLFNSQKVLRMDNTQFSNGNLARADVEVSDKADFFCRLPFEKIYHEGSFPPEVKDEIIFHRHAEVIIPNELDLENLSFILCRSQAEEETLVNLLDKQTLSKYKIGLKPSLFHHNWPYVLEANLSKNKFYCKFNRSEKVSNLKTTLYVEDLVTNKRYKWESENYDMNSILDVNLSSIRTTKYRADLFLDDNFCYRNYFIEDDFPF